MLCLSLLRHMVSPRFTFTFGSPSGCREGSTYLNNAALSEDSCPLPSCKAEVAMPFRQDSSGVGDKVGKTNMKRSRDLGSLAPPF